MEHLFFFFSSLWVGNESSIRSETGLPINLEILWLDFGHKRETNLITDVRTPQGQRKALWLSVFLQHLNESTLCMFLYQMNNFVYTL